VCVCVCASFTDKSKMAGVQDDPVEIENPEAEVCACANRDVPVRLCDLLRELKENHPNTKINGKVQKNKMGIVRSIRFFCSRARTKNKPKATPPDAARTSRTGVLSVGCSCRFTFYPSSDDPNWMSQGCGKNLANAMLDTTAGTVKGCYHHSNGCVPSAAQKELVEAAAGVHIDPKVLEGFKVGACILMDICT